MATNTDPTNTFIGVADLKNYGIRYATGWLNVPIKEGKFPVPIYLSRKRRMWRLSAVLEFIADREANPPSVSKDNSAEP
jgi:hypothetical protein